MSDGDEAQIQLEEAKTFLAGLPSDPSDFTDAELRRLEEFLLSDNHGVVSVTGEFVRGATARDADAMAPLVQPLIDAVVHTDSLRRPPLVAAIEHFDRTRTEAADPVFDRTPVARADPIEQYHATLADTETEELERSKRATALAAFYDLFPQEVRGTVPTLLDCLEPREDDLGLLCEAAGKALGTIAGKDDQVRSQVVDRFERELDRGPLPNKGVVYGVANLLSHRSDSGLTLVEPLVETAMQTGVESAVHEASRWHVVSAFETIAEDRPALLEPHLDQLGLLLRDDERLVRKGAIKLFGTLGETDPSVLEEVVDDLVAAADDPDAEIRKRAVTALSPLQGRQEEAEKIAINAHFSDMDSDEWRDTLTALNDLKRLSDRHPSRVIDGLDKVVDNLDHQKWSVRSSAATVLGKLGSERPDAIRPLVFGDARSASSPESTALLDALEDDHKQVRADAAQALGRIGGADRELCDAVFGPLADAVEDDDTLVENRAVQALGRIGEAHPGAVTDEHVSAIAARLDHVDELVRAAAAEAVGAIANGGRERHTNVLQLVDLLDDYYAQPRIEACRALANLGADETTERIAPLRTHYDEDVQEAAEEALEVLDYESAETDTEQASTEDDAPADDVSDTPPTNEVTDDTASDLSPTTEVAAESLGDTSAWIPDVTTAGSPPQESLEYDQLELGEQLGQGASGVVYRAQYHSDGETVPVALKVPNFEGTMTQSVIEDFVSEADTWSALASRDHVVGVIDSGTQPRPWIAMELMDGGTLRDRIGEFSVEQAIWTAERIAQGVRHDRTGVLHLDLKPANVLFRTTDDDTWDVPKVADWGIARALKEHQPTVEGMSPTYAAPEQFDADEFGAPSSQTDIYQLGVVTYELLTGRPPFEGDGVAQMHAILTDEPEPPAEVNDAVPQAVSDAVVRALSKRPEERFSTVERFQSVLQSHR